MKRRRSAWGAALGMGMWLLSTLSSHAAAMVWTNLGGGNWSEATNWSPNVVPSTNDDAFITNGGTYDVSLDISPTINSLTVGGGSNGVQTLHTGISLLTVNNASDISTNGAFDLEGGSFYGPGPMLMSGSFLWTGGYLGGGPGATVSVAPSGVMSLEGQSYTLYGIISNGGSILMASGSLAMFGSCFNDNGMLINLSGDWCSWTPTPIFKWKVGQSAWPPLIV